jgi:predicted enzyme related to lactoylglutathione lyase
MPATDVAGVGRIARLADPYGARFALIKSAPQQS